jgi:hypothetical protein
LVASGSVDGAAVLSAAVELLASGSVGIDAVKPGTVKIQATSRVHTLDASTFFGLSREGGSNTANDF